MKNLQLRRRDSIQIAYHWVNFVTIAALTTTGLAIYLGAADTASYFAWHLWMAWVLLAALVIHIWHDTVTLKRFDRMWVTREDLRAAVKRLRSPGASDAGPKHGHYKVEQIVFHWVLALDVIGLIITGLILWQPGRMFVAPFWMPWGWDAIFFARVLHQVFTMGLIVLVLAHVYFALLVPKNRLYLKSIFTGRVPLAEYAEEHRISPRLESNLKGAEGDTLARGVPVTGGGGAPMPIEVPRSQT
jgi:thiosulfate reductase cytochrome b subunit